MRVYKDTAYGQDIDGNRGTTIYEIELEDSDKPYILEELYKYFVDGEYEKEVSIFLYSEKLDREVEFNVEIEDYLEDFKRKIDLFSGRILSGSVILFISISTVPSSEISNF